MEFIYFKKLIKVYLIYIIISLIKKESQKKQYFYRKKSLDKNNVINLNKFKLKDTDKEYQHNDLIGNINKESIIDSIKFENLNDNLSNNLPLEYIFGNKSKEIISKLNKLNLFKDPFSNSG